MSDFGANTCDFHSDFRTEGNDYASDFGGEPRTAKQPPETQDTETAPPGQGQPPARPQGHKDGGKLVAQAAICGA